ncbi:RNA polymerase sigma factor sigma-70 region 4 domain-containing protein [Candidatus Nitrosocosmicus sp. R]
MISRQVEELIVQDYIFGLSRDEIATETGVAPGSVSNRIIEWKRRIEAICCKHEKIRNDYKTVH